MRIFYDVDTQNDFMNSDGALPVPGAEEIKPNLERLTQYARAEGIPIRKSRDRHFGTLAYKHLEGELKVWGGPFDMHCEDGTFGQENIRETAPINPIFIENKAYSSGEISDLLSREGEVIIEKQHYDVFTNPNTERVLEGVSEAVVYGVATEYCDKAVVLGMRKRKIEVYVVTDAISAITSEGEAEALDEMRKAGAKFITTEEVLI